jgi:hypothetical protein
MFATNGIMDAAFDIVAINEDRDRLTDGYIRG